MKGRGLIAVYAMARPRRPDVERVAVIQAAGVRGTALHRATRLAHDVAAVAIEEVDREPEDHVISLLRDIAPTPVRTLATDPTIDTAALVLAERMRRLACRGGRRLPEREWAREDREIATTIAAMLARRYRRLLSIADDCCRKPGKRHSGTAMQGQNLSEFAP